MTQLLNQNGDLLNVKHVALNVDDIVAIFKQEIVHLSFQLSWGQCYKTSLAVIYKFLYKATVFIRIDRKSSPITNTVFY